jgi:hypothetical protein
MIHEDSPHRLGSHAKEMSTVRAKDRRMVLQPQKRLMHKGCCLQCVSGTLARKPNFSNPAKLRINLGGQVVLFRLTAGH